MRATSLSLSIGKLPSVKRSPQLAGLSRDHHHALEVALRLQRATAADLDDAVRHFRGFWDRHGQRHFAIEEDILLPALPADDRDLRDASVRIRAEHHEIRMRAGELADAPSVEAAHRVGKLLRAHVRYEERHVFPLVEERLPPKALARVGLDLEAAGAP